MVTVPRPFDRPKTPIVLLLAGLVAIAGAGCGGRSDATLDDDEAAAARQATAKRFGDAEQ